MAMAVLWTGMVVLSVVFGMLNGRMEAVSTAATGGSGECNSIMSLHGGRTLPLERRHGDHEPVRNVREAGACVSPAVEDTAAQRQPGQ